MAAKTYYSQHALSVSDQDQQHLLAPSISSPGFAADADADGRKMNVKREYRRFDDGQGDLEDLDRVVHRDAVRTESTAQPISTQSEQKEKDSE